MGKCRLIEMIGDRMPALISLFRMYSPSAFSLRTRNSPPVNTPHPLCSTFAFFHEPCPPRPNLYGTAAQHRFSTQRTTRNVRFAQGPLAPEKIPDIIGVAVTKVRELDALVKGRLT
jgi:hypothetical protein